MTGRAFTGKPAVDPQPAQRAQAAITGFLQQHRQMAAGYAQALRAAPGGDAAGPDALPDAFARQGPAPLGDYPVYAVHFANEASRRYAALLDEPLDDEALFRLTCDALGGGLGLAPREAAELTVKILLQTPHNTDGSELDDAQIRTLSQDELRWILIAEIAQRDADVVLAALERGEETVDLSAHNVGPAAELLDLPAHPAPR